MLRKTVAVLVALGLAVGLSTAVLAQYGQGPAKPDATKASPAAQSSEVKKSAEKVTLVTGKVKSVAANSLVVQVSGKTAKEMTFDLTGTAIKAGGKDAAISDLKDGDEVRVGYTESDGKLVAKTVTARPGKAKK